MIKREELEPVGVFNKPHGINGEISATFENIDFEDVDIEYLITDIDGIFVPFFIEQYRSKNDTTMLIKFEDLDTEESVKELCNHTIYVKKSVLSIDENQVSSDYFIGFTIVDDTLGEIGKIEDLELSTANALFVVKALDNSEILIPITEEYITNVDEKNKILGMNLPQGLIDL